MIGVQENLFDEPPLNSDVGTESLKSRVEKAVLESELPMTISEVSDKTGGAYGSVKAILCTLYKDGRVAKPAKGRFMSPRSHPANDDRPNSEASAPEVDEASFTVPPLPEEDGIKPEASAPREKAMSPRILPWRLLSDTPPPPPRFLVRGMIPAVGVTALVGAPGSGKSFFAASLAAAVATGGEFAGETHSPGSVVWFAYEDTDTAHTRIRSMCPTHDVPVAFFEHHALEGYKLTAAGSAEILIASAKNFSSETTSPIRLVVIDSLSSGIDGDENVSTTMRPAIMTVRRIADALNCAVLLIAHSTKNPDSTGVRGHSAATAELDSALHLQAKGDSFSLSCTKARHVEKPEPMTFRLASDDAGALAMRLVSTPTDRSPPNARDSARKRTDADRLAEIAAEIPVFGMSKGDLKELYKSDPSNAGKDPGTVDRAFRRAITTLTEDGSIRVEGDTVFRASDMGTSGHCLST